MGGLAGIIHHQGDPPRPTVLRAMSAQISHRGADGSQVFLDGPAALTQRITPSTTSASRAPFVSDRHVVLLNGWAYIHDSDYWRREGIEMPDTRAGVVYEAWRRWGVDFTAHVGGDFAIAIWDREQQVLHLFRDRMGIKPLFFARTHGRIAFASEIGALLKVPWVSRDIARENLAEYLSFRVVHAPRTLLSDVHQLEPAQWLRFTKEAVRTGIYWRPPYAHPQAARPRESEVIPALQDAVDRAVRRRLPASTEAGVYLSGGPGSAAITAAAKGAYQRLQTFTVSFADDPYPESAFAGRVARLLGMEHHDVVVGSQELADSFVPTVRALGHPVGNPAAVLQMLMAQAARSHVKTVLTGDGGDELFGGRNIDRAAHWIRRSRWFGKLPAPTRSLLRGFAKTAGWGEESTSKLDNFGLTWGLGGADLFSTRDRHRLLGDELARPRVRQEVLEPFYTPLATDPINAILHAHTRSTLAEETLVRADRTGAVTKLDMRFPLLDREVVRVVAQLPGSFKIWRAGGSIHTRWPLRALLGGVLPQALLNRPDRGMPTPLHTWLAGPGRLFLEHRFSRLLEDPLDLWDPDFLHELHNNVHRDPMAGRKLWALFIFDAWAGSITR